MVVRLSAGVYDGASSPLEVVVGERVVVVLSESLLCKCCAFKPPFHLTEDVISALLWFGYHSHVLRVPYRWLCRDGHFGEVYGFGGDSVTHS